jgi:prepilin-type N-terminal cleavage/methylation domain-containing protein
MNRRAFTLVELLVVIAIIGLLSTVAIVSLNSSRLNARNTKRKADLLQISKALELYYSYNNAYPDTGGAWQGVCSSYLGLPDSGPTAWIPGLAPTYMAVLPRDPNTGIANNGTAQPACQTPGQNCYLYRSTPYDYKLLAHCTPEGPMSAADPFYDYIRPYWGWTIYTQGGKGW